ncbi:polyprenyl synthetase family protein [Arthrobacter sp. 260]|uniref:polyprenyl synthetase family protein n=1 Tax=Arthrobacter sp. 260 TaxID=2735314 RepID=UPI0014922824|nr:polyprenyl synthetase family protein [Arthrobacter sp. 260]NOJ59829.1 polyprenyl synthetase family protein [Arthrobacter sp. 260]
MTATNPLVEEGSVEQLVTSEQTAYRAGVTAGLDNFLARQREILASIAEDALEPAAAITRLTAGGKRLRALLCYWGFRGAGGAAGAPEPVLAGVALELFQAAALIHDDVIDRSDTRRGSPSVHRQFGTLHEGNRWHLSPDRFGVSAAILTGDMCLSFSEEQFSAIGAIAGSGTEGRAIFNRMRTEVMAGQYLDLLEEAAGPDRTPSEAAERARQIVRFKSAKYSIEHPLGLGGALAGASPAQLRGYSAFSLPLGEAFQLRDDVLGVFGDPLVTGKPAGDDLREGKRTLLIAQALKDGSPADRQLINSTLGRADLDDDGVSRLRDAISTSGALQAVESLIAERWDASTAALDQIELDTVCRSALSGLATAAVSRSA